MLEDDTNDIKNAFKKILKNALNINPEERPNLNNLKVKIEKLESKYNTPNKLVKKLSNKKSQLELMDQSYKKVTEELEKTNGLSQSSQKELIKAKSEIEKMMKENNRLEEEVKLLQEDKKSLAKTNVETNNQLDNCTKKNKEYLEELNKKESKIKELMEKIDQLEKNIQEKEKVEEENKNLREILIQKEISYQLSIKNSGNSKCNKLKGNSDKNENSKYKERENDAVNSLSGALHCYKEDTKVGDKEANSEKSNNEKSEESESSDHNEEILNDNNKSEFSVEQIDEKLVGGKKWSEGFKDYNKSLYESYMVGEEQKKNNNNSGQSEFQDKSTTPIKPDDNMLMDENENTIHFTLEGIKQDPQKNPNAKQDYSDLPESSIEKESESENDNVTDINDINKELLNKEHDQDSDSPEEKNKDSSDDGRDSNEVDKIEASIEEENKSTNKSNRISDSSKVIINESEMLDQLKKTEDKKKYMEFLQKRNGVFNSKKSYRINGVDLGKSKTDKKMLKLQLLVFAIKKNTTLTDLALQYCNLKPDEMRILAKGIKECNLRLLVLGSVNSTTTIFVDVNLRNELDKGSAEMLVNAMECNKQLEEFSVCGCIKDLETEEVITNGILNSKSLKEIYLYGFSNENIEKIEDEKQDANTYYDEA